MRDDERFEISRAFDLLPHVVGASWAVAWFRMTGNRKPTREEFREKAAEFYEMPDGLYRAFDGRGGRLGEMAKYIGRRRAEEARRMRDGQNKEIEKRYDRYVDYG